MSKCVFIKLYITVQPGLVVVILLCCKYGSILSGSLYVCVCERKILPAD